MGFDAGVLKDAHPDARLPRRLPRLGRRTVARADRPGALDEAVDLLVLQQVTQALGQARFQQYTTAFGYGNEDATSPAGELNGVMGAWVNASLRISPLEQVAFMRKIANRTLLVSAHAYDMTERITLIDTRPDGWIVHGKTGTGSPGRKYDASHAYGWFVGWAAKAAQGRVRVPDLCDDERQTPNAGLRARDTFLATLPAPRRTGQAAMSTGRATRADRPAARRVDRARPAASLQHPLLAARHVARTRIRGCRACDRAQRQRRDDVLRDLRLPDHVECTPPLGQPRRGRRACVLRVAYRAHRPVLRPAARARQRPSRGGRRADLPEPCAGGHRRVVLGS